LLFFAAAAAGYFAPADAGVYFVKDQSLTIQQTFARQKFDQKRRAHEHAHKPSARGAEASANNSLLFKQYIALLGAGRS